VNLPKAVLLYLLRPTGLDGSEPGSLKKMLRLVGERSRPLSPICDM